MSSTIPDPTHNPPTDWLLAGLVYHSPNFFYRKKLGAKVWKISIDAGCDCPNRDGILGTAGCIFCDPASFSPSRRAGDCPDFCVSKNGTVPLAPGDWSIFRREGAPYEQTPPENTDSPGDWSIFRREGAPYEKTPPENMDLSPSAPPRTPPLPITAQINHAVQQLSNRSQQVIAYVQPATNTYGPLDQLRRAYEEALAHPNIVGLVIGTRPDCVGNEVLDLLAELSSRTWLVVEYGLQTIHDRSLDWIGRGHHYDAFLDAYRRSRERNLNIGVHVILGLPGESPDDMRATADELARLELHSIKPHNLHAVRDTRLADLVTAGQVRLPELSEYVNYLVDFLERLPGTFVIERLCGDAPRDYLLGPAWCLDKSAVRQAVETEFRRRGTFQGGRWKAENSSIV